MSQKRKRHSAQFKAKVALEAVKGLKSSSELAREFQVHPAQISQWKRLLLETLPEVFNNGKTTPEAATQEATAPLYEEIGRLKMDLDWVKKALPSSTEGKRMMIQPSHSKISTARQCDLIGLARSSYYYKPAAESDYNLALMRSARRWANAVRLMCAVTIGMILLGRQWTFIVGCWGKGRSLSA